MYWRRYTFTVAIIFWVFRDAKSGASGIRRVSNHCMDTLSRREEETLLKSTKERALKECDHVVRGMYSLSVPGLRATS